MWTDPFPTGELHGSNGFRLFPTDELYTAPASGRVAAVAGGFGLHVTYTWEHREDGPQHGVMLIASPEEDGALSLAWLDSWHQKPNLTRLQGSRTADGCAVSVEYFEHFSWEIDVALSATEVAVTMRNVVAAEGIPPDQADTMPAGPYDVMVLRLS